MSTTANLIAGPVASAVPAVGTFTMSSSASAESTLHNTVTAQDDVDLSYFVYSNTTHKGTQALESPILDYVQMNVNGSEPIEFKFTSTDNISDFFEALLPDLEDLYLYTSSNSTAEAKTDYGVTDKNTIVELLLRFAFFRVFSTYTKADVKGTEVDLIKDYGTTKTNCQSSLQTQLASQKTTLKGAFTANQPFTINSTDTVQAAVAELLTDIIYLAKAEEDSTLTDQIEDNINAYVTPTLGITFSVSYKLTFVLPFKDANNDTNNAAITTLVVIPINIAS